MIYTRSEKCWYGIPSHTVPLRALSIRRKNIRSNVVNVYNADTTRHKYRLHNAQGPYKISDLLF